jgi:hypothetical protein
MKGRKQRNTGGVNQADEDLATKPEKRVVSKINAEAEERKAGGRAGRKRGGPAKDCGPVKGEKSAARADRMPRKSGGRANATDSPFSSARTGNAPGDHKTQAEMD